MLDYVLSIWKRRSLIYYLTVSGLKVQQKNTFIGFFWWLLDPLIGIAIYYFIVAIIFRGGGSDYGMFLVIGIVMWRWASSAITSASKSITTKEALITQINLPKLVFPISSNLSEFINFLFGLTIIFVFMFFSHFFPTMKMLWFPFIVVVQLFFLMVLGFIFAYISVFVRDIDNIIQHVMRIWFFVSPVIWGEDMVRSQKIKWILNYNPMTYFLRAYRNIFIYDKPPDFYVLLVIGVVSLFLIVWITYFYYKNEHKIIKYL